MGDASSDLTVSIHGDSWLVCHIREDVEWCRSKTGWILKPWRKRAALVDKYHSKPYTGQKIRTESQRIEPDGWEHDHCQICWWTLSEGDDPCRNQGYTYDGTKWVCTECFTKFIGPERLPIDEFGDATGNQ